MGAQFKVAVATLSQFQLPPVAAASLSWASSRRLSFSAGYPGFRVGKALAVETPERPRANSGGLGVSTKRAEPPERQRQGCLNVFGMAVNLLEVPGPGLYSR